MLKRLSDDSVFEVGAKDPDRKYFDEFMPLPRGTSYNSYIIRGSEKTALIDTVEPEKYHDLLSNIKDTGVDKIDYIISNHAEQDHSGSISLLMKDFPGAKVVTNKKCRDMLIDLIDINEDDFIIIEDNQEMSLGDKTLRFILFPWVHWPETMLTYLVEDKILFTCDLFGSHFSTEEVFASKEEVYVEAKRYYAEIMMPFANIIRKNLDKIISLDMKMIAPSHGPVYDDHKKIISLYQDWASEKGKKQISLVFVSMHGSTKKAVEIFEENIPESISLKIFDMGNEDIGELAISLVDSSAIVIATPTVLNRVHPRVANALFIINTLKPKAKLFSSITSFGWASTAQKDIEEMLSSFRPEFISPVTIKGYPRGEDEKKIAKLVAELSERLLSL